MRFVVPLLTLILAAAALGAAKADNRQVGNLGYNSYEGYLSGGQGLNKRFGPGVGYPTGTNEDSVGFTTGDGDYFRRYIPQSQWGTYGFGTGHMGEGYGPYIFGRRSGGSPPGMFDPLPGTYQDAPPPSIKVGRGQIVVKLPNNLPGVRRVTVTVLAFNNAELESQCLEAPPFNFVLPVVDGVKSVRVRIDYVNNGLSATSYAL